MAACKTTVDPTNSAIQIHSADLPITCILQNPPPGVTISEAEFFPNGQPPAAQYPVTAGQSFVIPALPAGTTGKLGVRIIGKLDGQLPVWVVEQCDEQLPIVAINGLVQKMALKALEVIA